MKPRYSGIPVKASGMHVGIPEHVEIQTMYRCGRTREVEVLCDPGVPIALADAGIAPCSFDDLDAARRARIA